jgi:7-cyano-7-deazaguanine synthase in queuosine biosynthesis
MYLEDEFGQSINFHINPSHKRILLNLSGGADSALVFYLLVKYLIENERHDTTIGCLTLAFHKRYRWQARRSANIIEYMISKFNYYNILNHHTVYGEDYHDSHLHKYHKEVFERNEYDMLIGGNTANPRFDVDIELKNGEHINLWKDCDPMIGCRNETNIPDTIDRYGKPYYSPFANVDKRFVASVYKQFDLDDLLQETRSCCTNMPDYEEPCGYCWSCGERKLIWGDWNYAFIPGRKIGNHTR